MNASFTMQEKAKTAWGSAMPDWVGELATLADKAGVNGCAKRVGYSSAVISQALSNKYPGDLSRVEEKVRGALMGEKIVCPALGEIGRDRCLDWQAKPRAVTNSTRSKVYRACRSGCEHSRLKGGDDA